MKLQFHRVNFFLIVRSEVILLQNMSGLSRTNIQYELKKVQEKKIVKNVSCQILNTQVCICFDNQLKPHCYMADIGFKIREK